MPRHPQNPVCGYESPDEEHLPSMIGLRPARAPLFDAEKAIIQTPPAFTRPTSSLNDVVEKARNMKGLGKVSLRDRIGCFQWTWFTMTMATGGIANVLFTG